MPEEDVFRHGKALHPIVEYLNFEKKTPVKDPSVVK